MTIRSCRAILHLLLFWLLQAGMVNAAEITIRSDEQLRLAQEAMAKGEYPRAVVELERFLHFFPHDEQVPQVRYLIGLSYVRGKEFEKGRKALEEVRKDYAGSPIGGEALFLIGESYYRQGLPEEAERYFQMVLAEVPQPEIRNRALYRIGWCRMKGDRWKDASQAFQGVEQNSPLHLKAKDLSGRSLQGESLPSKDPAAAGLMAAVLPGLGHAYCERYKDGLVAFLLNGLFIWAAYEAFEEDHSVLGGILTFLELGWYTGNIYSAVNTAHKYNRAVKNEFLRNLGDELDVGLLTSKQGHLGLALQMRF